MKNFSPILLIVFLVYVCLTAAGMLHHELSLDEAHHWLLARDSASISNLIYNSRYDGHPFLWDLVLFFIAGISKKVIAMQITHLIVSCTAAFLFLTFSPFTLTRKVLIIFGYFFFFEYNLISRSYNLTWLFLVVLCILFSKEKRNYLWITIVLFLLANTHLFSLVCSIPFFIILFKESFQEKRSPFISLGSALLFALGLAVSIWSIIPPADSGMVNGTVHDLHFSFTRSINAFSFFIKGMFCFPDYTSYNFWNTNYFISHLSFLAAGLFFIAFLLPLFCFNKKDSLFIFYFSGLVITILFYLLKLSVGAHYMGYCFMLFLVSFWMDRNYRTDAEYYSPTLPHFISSIGNIFFWFALAVQALSGGMAFYLDMKHPFSEGKNLAEDLRTDLTYRQEAIVVMPFNTGPPIAAYLDRPLYYPENDKWGTFCYWNTNLLEDKKEVAVKIDELLNKMTVSSIALVLSYPPNEIRYLENCLALDPHPFYQFKDIKTYQNSISVNGNYTVFYFERKK